MWKRSGNPKVEELTKSRRSRSYNLGCLQAVKLEQLNEKGRPRRLCAWCALEELTHGNQKYCSDICSTSAMAWAYPQKEDSLRFLLERQVWKCNLCQFDYTPFLEEIVRGDRHLVSTVGSDFSKLYWYHFKRLKARVPSERNPEVDHIVPIYKGGESLGLDNHQAICYTCHKAKSRVDNSGPRKKDGVV